MEVGISMKDISPTTIINAPMTWRVVDLRIRSLIPVVPRSRPTTLRSGENPNGHRRRSLLHYPDVQAF